MKKIVYLLSIVFISLNCILPVTFPTTKEAEPIASLECLDSDILEITDTDIDTTREFKKSLFSEQTWNNNYYTVYGDQVMVVYTSNQLNAVAVVKNIALCDAKNNLKAYADEDTIAIILTNYGEYKQVASCEKDGILLFQFDSVTNEINYDIKLWINTFTTRNRVLEVFLAFPKADAVNMRKYSQSLYPGFVSCNN